MNEATVQKEEEDLQEQNEDNNKINNLNEMLIIFKLQQKKNN
jgi:hypothetical protein